MSPNAPSRLMAQLPGVYHTSEDLGELLTALETIVFAPSRREGPAGPPALEAEIANIAWLFDVTEEVGPEPWLAQARYEFLPWLSEWVALSRTFDLSLERQRGLVGRIVPLYAWRGTRKYLTDILSFHLRERSEVQVNDQEFVGLTLGRSKIGVDTWLERDRPFWFKVTVRMSNAPDAGEDPVLGRDEWLERIGRIIELAKPAHTTYDLELVLQEPDDQRGD